MAMARLVIWSGSDLGIGVRGCDPLVLIVGLRRITHGTMIACHRPKQGQTLIIGIRRLDFFTLIDAARSGVGASGSRDHCGGENTKQGQSQGFIL